MRRKLLAIALFLVIGSIFGISRIVGRQLSGAIGAPTHLEPNAVAFRILLGRGDKTPTTWDGSVSVSSGGLINLEGWRFREGDQIVPPAAWRAHTGGGRNPQILPLGIVVTITSTPQTAVRVATPQGAFDFNPINITSIRPTLFLKGAIAVERVSPEFRLTSGPTENDFPAAAQAKDGTTWIAYVAYQYGTGDVPIMGNWTKQPPNFDRLVPVNNGDQLRLARISADGTTFADIANLTEPGQDVLRPAVVVDNDGAVWCVWSQRVHNNWDLYASRYGAGTLSPTLRLTNDLGPDLAPALARDDSGGLWLAWQGFRNGQSDIFVSSMPNGSDRWGTPVTVSNSPLNDWDPAIACAHDGSVYVAWDTYDKGDYDVRMRRLNGPEADTPGPVTLGPVVAVANTPLFEARASVACDSRNRAWIAYEEGSPLWGKDTGYVVQNQGNPLYINHTVKVRVYENDQPYHTAGDVSASFQFSKAPAVQRSFPRLAASQNGQIYLTFRQTVPVLRAPIGSTWLSYITAYTGNAWAPAEIVPDSDGVGDARPAIVPRAAQVSLVHVSDGRSHAFGTDPRYDIYVASSSLSIGSSPPQLVADGPIQPHQVSPQTVAERMAVARVRGYRPRIAGRAYQLLRGDYHRHTEISFDGGADGPLVDMFRYAMDAASQDWICAGDHDYGAEREYTWWQHQKLDDAYHVGPQFVPVFGYERSVGFPNGHRNLMFVQRGIRPLPRLVVPGGGTRRPQISPGDTKMLYSFLRQFNGICASHTSATVQFGTDWRDNDPVLEPIVEIYQGDRLNSENADPATPRAANAPKAPGGYQAAGVVWNAFRKGYKFGFEASSDHHSTHISYGVAYTETPTREGIVDAFRKRHTYAATDNIVVDVRSGEFMMGDELVTKQAPRLHIIAQGTNVIARVLIVKDNAVVHTVTPNQQNVDLTWMDNEAKLGQHYYYVRIEQADGQLAWASPIWITYLP